VVAVVAQEVEDFLLQVVVVVAAQAPLVAICRVPAELRDKVMQVVPADM
jgi:hypothetical protein